MLVRVVCLHLVDTNGITGINNGSSVICMLGSKGGSVFGLVGKSTGSNVGSGLSVAYGLKGINSAINRSSVAINVTSSMGYGLVLVTVLQWSWYACKGSVHRMVKGKGITR